MNELLALSLAKKQKLTKTEINAASDQIKTNLVNALLKVSHQLCNDDSISPKNLVQLSRLTDTAERLFNWPRYRPLEWTASELTLPSTTAINLALIRTTPEQLRAKARLIAPNSSNEAQNPDEQKKLAS